MRDFPEDRRREEALYRLAESYRQLGRGDDALAAYSYQVQAYPDGPLRVSAELRRGAILYDAGKFADAVAPLQFVVDKDSGAMQESAKFLLGRALLATGKEADGRALLQPLVEAQPAGKLSGSAAQALAELDDSQEKFAEAFPLWQKTLDLASDPAVKAIAAARGGWAALQAKKPEAAEKLFNTARTLDAKGDARKVANTGLLRLLFAQKRYSDWLKLYLPESAAVLDSAKAEIFYDLGHAHFVLKHWADAVDGFDQYLAVAPHESDAAMTAAYERFLAVAQVDRTKTAAEAEAYLKAYTKTPYRARVRLLEAQELSREKKYADALPLWQKLAEVKGDSDWPRQDILLQLARTQDELGDFANAATAYQAYVDEGFPRLEEMGKTMHTGPAAGEFSRLRKQLLASQARLAACLQNSNQLLAATNAWKAVESFAPHGSPEQEAAVESLLLIYAKGGPGQQPLLVDASRKLIANFPQSPLRAMAAFTVGDALFQQRDYAGAEPLLSNARTWDATNWTQPATQRLLLGAYGAKDYDKTVAYLKEYDALPQPADAQAKIAMRVPAALIYWLGDSARAVGKWDVAEAWYARVTRHADAGDLLAGAWWQLGEVQAQRKEWPAAVASYEKYRELKPDAGKATQVLLALGRAELGAHDLDAAKKLGEQALLQEPEGARSAEARMLLGETAFAAKSFAEAARMFATLAVLFDGQPIALQAMARAGDAFAAGGDAKSAQAWRAKLQAKDAGFRAAIFP